MVSRGAELFVGRARELGQIERVLDAARNGNGSTVLIAGDAGIGKSRLVGEMARHARDAGFQVLVGRSIDLVGTELPYRPFIDALGPLADSGPVDSQLRLFEGTLALITTRSVEAPLLLVLEDVHWADVSTLDLIVFLAHNIAELPVLLLATCRVDEPASAHRMRRLADAVRHSGSAVLVDLGPLASDELSALLNARVGSALTASLTETIVVRSEGNPFFAEELVAAAAAGDAALPRRLSDLLLQRVARLRPATQELLRLVAVAGREIPYGLLRAFAARSPRQINASLREATEQAVLVADQAAGTIRFRHALLGEAVYTTLLPGEREQLHAKLAELLARAHASPAELAPHWAAAGRSAEAFAASFAAARDAQAVFALVEAYAHSERALRIWPAVPGAAETAGLDLAGFCASTAQLASYVGAGLRAVELARRALDLLGTEASSRTALLHVRLAEYLHQTGRTFAGLSALKRAVALLPPQPPTPELAYTVASLASGTNLAWRFAESLPIAERALGLARQVGFRDAEVRALTVGGRDLAYVGRSDDGLRWIHQALELAEQTGDHIGLVRAYVSLTDVLMMLGRFREAVEVGDRGLTAMRRYGIQSSVLACNQIESQFAIGEWDAVETRSAESLRSISTNFPYMLLMLRADLEIGRGDFASARAHLDAALPSLREDRGQGIYDVFLAELALWEHRWVDADRAVRDALDRALSPHAAQLRVWFCAKGLRACADLTAVARARRDGAAVDRWLARAGELMAIGRRSGAEAATVTPTAACWLALAEAEYSRAVGPAVAALWADAAAGWDRLDRTPHGAYCRWRQAEALVASGASRLQACEPLRAAHAVAVRLGAHPLLREMELLAQRARLDLEPLPTSAHPAGGAGSDLGLTRREAEVLALLTRGYTNREIAAELVISAKTASVHVAHILHKLNAPNRREAAAIANRLTSSDPLAVSTVHRSG